MNENVVDLTQHLRTDPAAVSFLAIMDASPQVADILRGALPGLTKDQQKALLTIVAFRQMGAFLPASIELLSRLPLLAGMHRETIGAAFQAMADIDLIEIIESNGEHAFAFPALELIVVSAVEDANAPRLIGLDGNKLR